MKLKDKVALVVGGGSGAGRATAKLLAEEGAKVMVADVDKESANKVAGEIKETGGDASTVQVDMTKEPEVENMVKTTLARYGQIDILCNIAGGSMGRFIRDKLTPFAEQGKAEWDRILDVNLNGARNCTKAVISHMIQRRSGKIVSFSSIAAVNGMKDGADYAAAKAGIIGLTKSLAIEMAPYGIQVNCITPSATLTERIQKYMVAARERDPNARKMDLSNFAKPEDLAAAVLFLVSENADHVSGQNIIFGVPQTR
jgi:3-oxoacyl-[acyl-carrier protein] reductase